LNERVILKEEVIRVHIILTHLACVRCSFRKCVLLILATVEFVVEEFFVLWEFKVVPKAT
jgi:hypothetical protein